MIGWSVVWLVGWLTSLFVYLLVGSFVGWLIGRLVGWLAGRRSFGWLVGLVGVLFTVLLKKLNDPSNA